MTPQQIETESRQKMFFVFTAAICLVIGGMLKYLRPDQSDVANTWSMIGAIASAIPVVMEVIEGLQEEASEASEFYINQLITLAVVTCIITGQYATGGIVGIILVIGHVLEERCMLGSNEAIGSLLNLSRTHARRLDAQGNEEEVDAELLQPGDHIRIRPGDSFPADGTVLSGYSTANQANITGEALPVELSQDSLVFAGTTNLTGLLEVQVEKAGNDTLLGRVKQIVEEAQQTRAPIMRLTEEYARYYLPLIVLIAGFVLFFTRDIQRSVSVVIVSVPCAFLLAGPTAMVAALASASRMGILVKSVRFFEVADKIDTVVFDKTGTLTTGNLQVIQVTSCGSVQENELLTWAAAIESHSTHPIAKAIVAYTKNLKLNIPDASSIQEIHGLGMTGKIESRNISVGRSSWLEQNGISIPDLNILPHLSAISIAIDQQYIGTLYLSDLLRKEAHQLPSQLQASGIEQFVMLTGDRFGVAQSIASIIGFTKFQADCLPAQKLEAVEKLKSEGSTVLVVGDGVNDAPALAAANLSIAMGAQGSDVAIQTADIALMSNDLTRVSQFIQLSGKTMKVINQNMLCGAIFIGISIVLSSAGYISPMAASFIHEFGAFFVIFNSARLLKFDGQEMQK